MKRIFTLLLLMVIGSCGQTVQKQVTANNAGALLSPSAATFRAQNGLLIGTDVLAYHANLSGFSEITSAADALPYYTDGAGAMATTTLSSFWRTVLDDSNAANSRTTLGAQAQSAYLDGISDGTGDLLALTVEEMYADSITTGGLIITGTAGVNRRTGTLWVDPVNGNDTTGARNRIDLPYLTIAEAENDATAGSNSVKGDVIVVLPGDYANFVPTKVGVQVEYVSKLASVNRFRWPNTFKALRTGAGPLKIAVLGDSVAGDPYDNIYNALGYAIGTSGGIGIGGSSVFNVSLSGGGSLTTDYTTWHQAFPRLSVSVPQVDFYSAGATSILCDTFKLHYAAKTGAGTFKIQTSLDGAAWVDEGGYTNVNAATGGSVPGVGTIISFTKTAGNYRMRVLYLTGVVDVVGAQLTLSTSRGVAYCPYAIAGRPLSDFISVPDSIKGPIMQSVAPHALFINYRDDAASINTALPSLKTFADTYMTTTDIICIGATPMEPSADDLTYSILQNRVMRDHCLKNKWAYFDAYSPFIEFDQGVTDGLLIDADVHPSAAGYAFASSACWEWLAWLDTTSISNGHVPQMMVGVTTVKQDPADSNTLLLDKAISTRNAAGGIHLHDRNGLTTATDWLELRNASNIIEFYDRVAEGVFGWYYTVAGSTYFLPTVGSSNALGDSDQRWKLWGTDADMTGTLVAARVTDACDAIKVLASNETRTSTTTKTDLTGLTQAVTSGETWVFDIQVVGSSLTLGGGGGGGSVKITGPTVTSFAGYYSATPNGANLASYIGHTGSAFNMYGGNIDLHSNDNTYNGLLWVYHVTITFSASGTFSVQASQLVSDPDATTFYAGSFLKARKL